MSGLQELAAIVGITEAALRSISALYSFVQDLRHAVREIESLRAETSALSATLFTLLGLLNGAGADIQALAFRVGLPHAINECGQACDNLHLKLSRWTRTGLNTWVTRLQFRRHRKDIENVVTEINVAKQTTILTVVVTQLSVHLKRSESEAEQFALLQQATDQIAELHAQARIMPQYFEPRTLSGNTPSRTQTQLDTMREEDSSRQSNRPGASGEPQAAKRKDSLLSRMSGAFSAAEEYVNSVRMKNVKTGDGHNNTVGIKKKKLEGNEKVDMENVYQGRGNGNVIGISES